ncbi:hypothetical protein MAR_004619 [Mya arenaria]|uniref:Uncharacterized protein n=1 Tax=Mya arenaria TaxID=6604 RepID=A0ABY7EZX2_MYAAR|nr:hypothetical protein MAR_004619 [Mya arenaria]
MTDDPCFWPSGVTCRPWVSYGTYRRRNHSDDDTSRARGRWQTGDLQIGYRNERDARTNSGFKTEQSNTDTRFVNWKTVKPSYIENYKASIEGSKVLINLSSKSPREEEDINAYYREIVTEINAVTKKCIPKAKFKPYIKPYWTKNISLLHKKMTDARSKWILNGRKTHESSNTRKLYKTAKAEFRKAHRYAVPNFIMKLEQEIDETAEMDQNQFWKLINKKRKKVKFDKVFEMNFSGKTCNRPEEINEGWKHYFTDLYSPDETDMERHMLR